MPFSEPSWWYGSPHSLPSRMLAPVSRVWAAAASRRLVRTTPYSAGLPVVCVGNFTAGGTGKTPLSILIAQMLTARGERPAFLTRGYGGRIAGPHRVNPALDMASDVGDEPLLLARHAPVVVARNRAAGAASIERQTGISPPTVIVMDDGLQNPSLRKDLTIAVVDARRGIGNGLVIPAGPLRAPFALQLELTDAVLVNRPQIAQAGEMDVAARMREQFHGPVLEATVAPASNAPSIAGLRLLALAGIANPARFTSLLSELGAEIVATRTFSDHHPFSEPDAVNLLEEANRLDLKIITTEKDLVRLAGATGARGELRDAALSLPIEMRLDQRDELRMAALLDKMLAERRMTAASKP